MSTQATAYDHRQEPTYWFAVLEIAREQSDFDRAAEANRQLARLGVRVKFARVAERTTAAVNSGPEVGNS